MKMPLTAEQEAQLARLAHQTGRSAEELALETATRFIVEDSKFCSEVQAGLDAAVRGDFVPTSEVWAKVERALRA
jgi:predicted transcriptional regulator